MSALDAVQVAFIPLDAASAIAILDEVELLLKLNSAVCAGMFLGKGVTRQLVPSSDLSTLQLKARRHSMAVSVSSQSGIFLTRVGAPAGIAAIKSSLCACAAEAGALSVPLSFDGNILIMETIIVCFAVKNNHTLISKIPKTCV